MACRFPAPAAADRQRRSGDWWRGRCLRLLEHGPAVGAPGDAQHRANLAGWLRLARAQAQRPELPPDERQAWRQLATQVASAVEWLDWDAWRATQEGA